MRRLLSYTIMVFMTLLAASCSYVMDNDVCTDLSDRGRAVYFRIELDEEMTATKADDIWGNPYASEIGTTFDSRIRPDAMFVMIYGPDNKVLGVVRDLRWWAVSGTQNVYEFKGDISHIELNTTDQYKVVIFANTGNPDENAQLDAASGPATMGFNIKSVDIAKEDSYIPMWGLITTKFTLTESQELGDISLLRAASKVRIRLGSAMQQQGYKISGASLNKYNELGYCLPTAWSSSTNTLQLYQEGCFRPFGSAVSTPLPFSVNNSGTEAVIYMPEFASQGVSDPITLTLTDGKGATDNYKLQFKNYVGGLAGETSFDIVRNHIYEYNISSITTGNELVLTCVVQPWIPREEIIDFTNEPSVSQTITWSNVESVNYETGEVVLYNDTNIEAACTFQIDTPVGATWTSSLITIEGNTDAFSWVDNTNYGLVGTGQPSTIKLKVNRGTPLSPQHICKLRITVQTLDGRTIVVHNLVPEGKTYQEFTIIQNSI